MTVIITNRPGATYTAGEKASWEVPYNIENATSDIDARIQLTLQSPGTYDGLYRQSVRVEHVGMQFYTGSVTYGLNDTQPSEGTVSYFFEIGGKTEKITQSLSNVRYPADAIDYEGAIGVVKNGDQIDVQGANLPVPSYSFVLKCHFPASYFTIARRNYIYFCSVAPVNNSPFWGFNAGEVRFEVASGGLKLGDTYGDIDFKFDVSPNATNLTIGDITGIAKGGWQYLETKREVKTYPVAWQSSVWYEVGRIVQYNDIAYICTVRNASPAPPNVNTGCWSALGSVTKSVIPKAVGVYVHTMHNTSDFNALLGV